jgi:hypothetical protein
MYVHVTLRRVHESTVNHGKAISFKYVCVCVSACVRVWVWVHGRGRVLARVQPYLPSMQRTCHILSVVPLAPPHFSTLSHKRHDFLKKKLLNIKCVF